MACTRVFILLLHSIQRDLLCEGVSRLKASLLWAFDLVEKGSSFSLSLSLKEGIHSFISCSLTHLLCTSLWLLAFSHSFSSCLAVSYRVCLVALSPFTDTARLLLLPHAVSHGEWRYYTRAIILNPIVWQNMQGCVSLGKFSLTSVLVMWRWTRKMERKRREDRRGGTKDGESKWNDT